MSSKYKKKQGFRELKKGIIIITEGKTTEPQYFNIFNNDIENKEFISIKILPPEDENNDGVLKDSFKARMQKCLDVLKNDDDFEYGDEICIVIDTDKCIKGTHQKNLKEIIKFAKDNKCLLAISNPCFEIWLYLHFDNFTKEEKDYFKTLKNRYTEKNKYIIKLLKKKNIGFKKNNIKVELFNDKNIQDALERSKKLDSKKNNYPTNSDDCPQTQVYKIVEKILETLENNKKLL